MVVAQSGADGQPDLGTLRAFLVTAAQGVSFSPDVWRE